MKETSRKIVLETIEGRYDKLITMITGLIQSNRTPDSIHGEEFKILTDDGVRRKAKDIFRRLRNALEGVSKATLVAFLQPFNWDLANC